MADSSQIVEGKSLEAGDCSVHTLRGRLAAGLAIPACPLALTPDRAFDERHQRALVRYYVAAGAGGVAVGVHTTQFAIHRPQVGLYQPVLELVAETVEEGEAGPCPGEKVVRVAGLVGDTAQARQEAALALSLGYDCGLLSLSAFRGAELDRILQHCEEVADVIPLFGFYLQPAVGGRLLPYAFWRRFFEIERVVAVKMAPFNRYHTLEVVRALADSGRGRELALYTGNDDHIVGDLLTGFSFGGPDRLHIAGGLLGHWAVWTQSAAEILERCKAARQSSEAAAKLLTLGGQVTDCNAAFFDVAHGFAGCIAGLHEVLRRQGLLSGNWCLDPDETLSPGQAQEIDRVHAAYPTLNDDAFVAEHLDEWLS